MKKIFLFALALLSAQFSRAQWEDDVRLTDTPDTSYLSMGNTHCIATSGDTVHILWRDKSEGNWEIFYKRSVDAGLNWEPDLRITYDPAMSYTPSMALSGSSLHAVWSDNRDRNFEIYYDRSIDGGANWEGELRLTDDLSYSYAPVVSVFGSNVHVVWVNVDTEGYYQIFYRHSPDGGITWAPEKWLSGFLWYSYNPSIAVCGSDVYVVWNDDRDENFEIYYIKSADNGLTWGHEIRLTNDPANSTLPSVAVSGSNVHIVWEDFRDGNSEIYYKGSVDGGINWGEDTRITFDPANSTLPNLAISNSVLHVVWQDYRNGVSEIFYNYSTDGGETWATDTQLNDFSFSSQRPGIAVSDSVLHVVWVDYRDFNYEIYYKRNPTGGLVGLSEHIAESAGLKVYPNPACNQLTVDSWQLTGESQQSAVSSQQSEMRIRIIDLFGRVEKEIPGITSLPYQINISDLADGIYLLTIYENEVNLGSSKFLKTNN